MQHFSSGLWTPLLAYAISVIGSLIGLSCMAKARAEDGRRAKVTWTVFGAFAIGGVAIWLMHFIAMLGFDVSSGVVKYSAPLTALSALIAVVMVGIGLSMVTLARFTKVRLVSAGVVSGLGVAGMHYMGMSAIRFQGEISYDPLLVAVSCLIAVVAATAAFWFTLVVKTTPARIGAGLIMGVAVTGMHFTGMAAVRVEVNPSIVPPVGTDVFDLVFPVFVLGGLVVAVLLWTLFTSENDMLAEPKGTAG
ncbi:MHYT domain-containing protein [Umezawaea tangerina]|uniref:NO-binding membrane sensor protein with MHYT domain n=1 Tax=Umezawaea tangerina TaxID=84725 RepID=A0A2T0T3W3_9PSEU|nr:MHYT domain-containing protein [Umezawaea tangerina]PRY40378.1 NO-binding membrane sensor protein with MHYT domain [Umezawaea tangerina]